MGEYAPASVTSNNDQTSGTGTCAQECVGNSIYKIVSTGDSQTDGQEKMNITTHSWFNVVRGGPCQ